IPESRARGLKMRRLADSTWSCVNVLQAERSACPPAYGTMPSTSAATTTSALDKFHNRGSSRRKSLWPTGLRDNLAYSANPCASTSSATVNTLYWISGGTGDLHHRPGSRRLPLLGPRLLRGRLPRPHRAPLPHRAHRQSPHRRRPHPPRRVPRLRGRPPG